MGGGLAGKTGHGGAGPVEIRPEKGPPAVQHHCGVAPLPAAGDQQLAQHAVPAAVVPNAVDFHVGAQGRALPGAIFQDQIGLPAVVVPAVPVQPGPASKVGTGLGGLQAVVQGVNFQHRAGEDVVEGSGVDQGEGFAAGEKVGLAPDLGVD